MKLQCQRVSGFHGAAEYPTAGQCHCMRTDAGRGVGTALGPPQGKHRAAAVTAQTAPAAARCYKPDHPQETAGWT